MLTNLSWLAEGQPYPPKSETDRIKRYELHEQLFLSEHPDAWKVDFDRIAREFKKKRKDVDTVFNYHQLLSKKTADFVCGEPPTVETEKNTDEIKTILDKNRFFAKLYEGTIDISRFGDAVLKLAENRLSLASPKYWFPIVASSDLKYITHHVIAYPITPDKDGKMTELYAEVHERGYIQTFVFAYDADSGIIGKEKKSTERTQTGIDDFTVQILTNVTHSGSIYGLDDYAIINSIVQKIMWRLHCADTILDKHSEPSMSGPASALEQDPKTGLWFLNLGNYFKREGKEDADVSYITWDGNLDSNFKELEILFNQLYTLTEMGQAFMEGGGGGEASSGTALKLRMVSPRVKAARIVGLNEGTVKNIISMVCRVNGLPVDAEDIALHWNDGLPNDEVEQINTLVTATGGKAVKSQYSAMKALGLSDDEVEAELEQIRIEEAGEQPHTLSVIDKNEDIEQ